MSARISSITRNIGQAEIAHDDVEVTAAEDRQRFVSDHEKLARSIPARANALRPSDFGISVGFRTDRWSWRSWILPGRNTSIQNMLLFFSRHPRVVLSSEQLALYVGYDLPEVARALDLLLGAGLLKRTLTTAPQGACMCSRSTVPRNGSNS